MRDCEIIPFPASRRAVPDIDPRAPITVAVALRLTDDAVEREDLLDATYRDLSRALDELPGDPCEAVVETEAWLLEQGAMLPSERAALRDLTPSPGSSRRAPGALRSIARVLGRLGATNAATRGSAAPIES